MLRIILLNAVILFTTVTLAEERQFAFAHLFPWQMADENGEASLWKRVDFQNNTVWLYVPPEVKQMTLFLHGCSQKASDLRDFANLSKSATSFANLVVVPSVPQGSSMGCWNYYGRNHSVNSPHHQYIIRLTEKILLEYPSVEQVNLVGLSSGGAEVNILGCLRPDLYKSLGLVASPSLGSGMSDLMRPNLTAEQVSSYCRQLAGSQQDKLSDQKVFLIAGNPDYVVNLDHSRLSLDSFMQLTNATSVTSVSLPEWSGSSLATGDITLVARPGTSTPQLAMAFVNGLGHAYPAGQGGAAGSYIKKDTLDFTYEFLRFIAAPEK